MFPSTSSRETSRLLGKLNKLFPSGPCIKCIIFDFKKEGTETEHVAVATSKCVPSGIFRRCSLPAKFQ